MINLGKIAPFPFLIIAIVLVFIGFAGYIRTNSSFISTNIYIMLSI